MTASSPPFPGVPHHTPGIVWYFVAPLLFIAGIVAMAVILFSQIGGITAGLVQVVVPGQMQVTLDKAGTYTIYHEYRSSVGGRIYEAQSVSGLVVTLRSQATGRELPLQPAKASSSYTLESRAGRSILNFTVTEPGVYLLSARYDDDRLGPQTVLAVGHSIVGSILFTVGAGLAALFAGLGGAVALVIVVAVKRHRARRAGLLA